MTSKSRLASGCPIFKLWGLDLNSTGCLLITSKSYPRPNQVLHIPPEGLPDPGTRLCAKSLQLCLTVRPHGL